MPRDPATTVTLDDLGTIVRLVRELGPPSQPAPRRTTAILALLIAFLAISPAAPRAAARHAFLPSSLPPIEESQMRMLRNLGVVSSIAIASAATAQDAVQWRVEDGGNGHWYQRVNDAGLPWQTVNDRSLVRGGHLATLTTFEENLFVGSLFPTIPTGPGYWFGGVKLAGEWTWVTGEPWDFVSWGSSADGCNDQPDGRDATDIYCIDSSGIARWSDDYLQWTNAVGYIVEWSADCNADSIVDYGQILAGELDDANGNNIPDCCEAGVPCDPCIAADLDASGAVNGVDLAIILNTWGTNGGKYPQADIDGDGVVGGADLALVLGAWGECQ